MNHTITLVGETTDFDSEFAISMPPECNRALRDHLRSGRPPFRIGIGEGFTLEIKIGWVGIPAATFKNGRTLSLNMSRRNLNELIRDLEDLAIPNHPLDHFHFKIEGDSARRNLRALVFERSEDDEYATLSFHKELAERSSR